MIYVGIGSPPAAFFPKHSWPVVKPASFSDQIALELAGSALLPWYGRAIYPCIIYDAL